MTRDELADSNKLLSPGFGSAKEWFKLFSSSCSLVLVGYLDGCKTLGYGDYIK